MSQSVTGSSGVLLLCTLAIWEGEGDEQVNPLFISSSTHAEPQTKRWSTCLARCLMALLSGRKEENNNGGFKAIQSLAGDMKCQLRRLHFLTSISVSSRLRRISLKSVNKRENLDF